MWMTLNNWLMITISTGYNGIEVATFMGLAEQLQVKLLCAPLQL